MADLIERYKITANLPSVLMNYCNRFNSKQIESITEIIYELENSIESADVQPVVDTENMAIVSDEFICKKCGIYLKDYIKVVMDEDNDGYIDEQHYEYEPKFCPECGAKVEGCIKTPKRDKPLYTMDEICKMNGVEFKDGDTK